MWKDVISMSNKNKKVKSNQNDSKKYYAFNPIYILWLIGFGFALWVNIHLLLTEHTISWILVIALVAFIIALFVDAVFYVFTKQEVYFLHFWGYKWRLPWFYVASIIKYGFWDSISFRHFMCYEVYYDRPFRGRTVRTTLMLTLTPKVKKYLNKFYVGDITGETKRRKKKK